MAVKMGITMIEMYCKMIREQFKPITEALDARNIDLKEICEKQAKKDLGIYDKMILLAQLELEIRELKEDLASFTQSNNSNSYKSKIKRLTDLKMETAKNGFHKKVDQAMNDMIFKIKISGLEGDTKEIFKHLPGTIESLTKDLKKLPSPTKNLKLIKSVK